MRHRSLLAYANYRYLKMAPAGRYGGTWLGYALGTIGALLIVWLAWFGARKRQYRSTAGTLQGWLSAHVYLGATLIVIATLHAAFQVGWNVHTLAYVLMLAVILSGFYGVWAYIRYPAKITETHGDDTQESLLLKIADIDRQARTLALSLPDAANKLVTSASQETRIGGTWRQQLAGRDPKCPTSAAVAGLGAIGKTLGGDAARVNQQLFALMARKEELVARARRAVALKARLDLWLFVHVPLSIALLGALTAHVVSVFFYW